MNFSKSKFLKRRLISKHFQLTQLYYLSQKCSNPPKNHYKVLGVPETCSQKDIKNAFIAKSKKLHPDKNPHLSQNHGSIVAVNEAYSVLGKEHTRKLYDAELMAQKYNHSYKIDPTNKNCGVFRHRDAPKNQPYYGIEGLKRLSNGYIAASVVLLMVIGSSFYFFLAHIAATHNYNAHTKKEMVTISNYNEVRVRAKTRGNDQQIEWFLDEIASKSQKEKSKCY